MGSPSTSYDLWLHWNHPQDIQKAPSLLIRATIILTNWEAVGRWRPHHQRLSREPSA